MDFVFLVGAGGFEPATFSVLKTLASAGWATLPNGKLIFEHWYMSKQYTDEEFINATPQSQLKLGCDICGISFLRKKENIRIGFIQKRSSKDCCSTQCRAVQADKTILSQCGMCGAVISIQPHMIKNSKSGFNFCSRSCSATYNNTHKTKGIRRSRLELWLEEHLTSLYPNLEIHYCQKDTINSELDIYIPSLKLAFECNGIFHYEPIYGPEKFSKIQNNDNRKFQACLEQGIELVIMDTSKVRYNKPKNFQQFLEIICNLIAMKMH